MKTQLLHKQALEEKIDAVIEALNRAVALNDQRAARRMDKRRKRLAAQIAECRQTTLF